jgi:two-component system, NarL family, sensor histidine kinase ComP
MASVLVRQNEQTDSSTFRPFLLFAFIALLVMIYVTGQHLTRPYPGFVFHWESGIVSSVDPSGPAAQAGVEPGDSIIALDGQPVRNVGNFYSDHRAGDVLPLTALRDREPYTTNLKLTALPAGILITNFTLIVLGLTFWILGVGVYWRHEDLRVGRDFLLFCLASAICIWVYPDADNQFEWARAAMYVGVSICGVALLSLHTRFPVKLGVGWQRVSVIGYCIAIAISVAGILVGPTQLGILMEDATGLSPWTPSFLVRAFFVCTALIAIGLLGLVYWRGTGQARRRIRLICFGTLLGLLPTIGVLLAEILAIFGLPADLALISGIAIPISYTISLRRNNLLPVETRLYQWTTTVVGILVMVMLYLAFTALATRLLNLPNHHAVVGALVVLTLLMFYSVIQTEIRRVLSRFFYGPEFNYMDVLATSLQKLGRSTDEVTPAEVLTEDIPPVLRIAHSGLWIRDGDLLQWRGGTLRPLGKQTLAVATLTTRLQDDTPIADESDSWIPLTGEARWWVPLVMAGELQGLWVLGTRERDGSFSPADEQFLVTAAREAALAIKVARVLRDLREQLDITEQAYVEARRAYNQVVTVRETEQRRIATDLHDDVVQRIFALTQTLHGIRSLVGQEVQQTDEIRLLIANASGIASIVGERTRTICYNLRPPELRKGLVVALQSLCEDVREQEKVEVQLVVRLQNLQLAEDMEIQLFRIVQEGLNNIVKHAHASLADVILKHHENVLRLIVSDDGQGFDVNAPRRTLGLDIVKERAKALGGICAIDSVVGEGTTITVEVPLSPSQGDRA